MKLDFIKFVTPELVEGARIIFYIPLPSYLEGIPFALEMPNGGSGLPVTITVVTTWFIILFFYLIFKFGTKKMSLIPGKFQTALESLYGFLDTIISQILGTWKNKYFTYLSCIFIFLLVSNTISFFPIPWFTINDGLFEIIPAFKSPTSDLNTTVGLALLTTVIFIGTAIKYNGIKGYLKGFLYPTPVMLPINIIGEMAKPLNISVRLFGNMFAGSVIMGLFYMAVPWVVPAGFHLYFDLFSGLVQSYVFVTLSMVYISGAIGDTVCEE